MLVSARYKNFLSGFIALGTVGCVQTSQAFIDNFDRGNTPAQTPANSPDLIGPQWTIGNGTWAIQNNQLVQDGGPNVGSQFILLNPLPTLNSGGTNFVVQGSIIKIVRTITPCAIPAAAMCSCIISSTGAKVPPVGIPPFPW
jgi:hypothetical protein